MQETIDLIAKYGYVILFLYSLGGGFIALVGASVLSFAGKMDLSLSIFVAIVANFLGDWLLFYMARYQKSMMQPYLTQHRRKLALVHILMRKYGSIIIVVKKYIYGLKTLVPLAIALTPYSLAKFNLYNAIGAIVWGISIGLLGYFSGGILIKGFEMLGEYPFLAPIFIAILLGGIWLWLSKVSKK
ncbi:DedA family protein [Helicobacter winghamensis]|uniref:DedA family protein n=1 Tax=Helicobacter winghamensis TaxID=157268 RepID=UPI00242C5590|nr:DedA family protein [Helicobacter winghamensis]